ncbi:geranylgeranylglycerol-phosphate geranylgeranyltransferase [Cyclobacteriaceae bacterium]|nr:geranylgeranylglycerol-phosphate geranylgeranyltransferase [Cyclobacteriaceae bacterium]
MSHLIAEIKGFTKAIRIPHLFGIVVVQFLTASYLIKVPNEVLLNWEFILLTASITMLAAAGYLINDYYDQKIDLINRPDRVVVGIHLRRRRALVAHMGLSILAIMIGLWIDRWLGLFNFFASFMLWLHSNYFRRVLLLGNIMVALMHVMIILVVATYFQAYNTYLLAYSLFAFVAIFIREVVKDLRGVKGDAAHGAETISVTWGIRTAKKLIYLSIFCGIIFMIYFLEGALPTNSGFYFLALLPFLGWFIYRIQSADTQSHYRTLKKSIDWIILSGILSIFLLHE